MPKQKLSAWHCDQGNPMCPLCYPERQPKQPCRTDQRSVNLAKEIADIDRNLENYFDFKFGGEGDNGEELILLLDIYFRRMDVRNR